MVGPMKPVRLPRLTKMEKLLLMSAGGQKLGPYTSASTKTWRIIRLVGQWTDQPEAELEFDGTVLPPARK